MQEHEEGHHQCKTCPYMPPCHLPYWRQHRALEQHGASCLKRAEKKAQRALFRAFEQQMQMNSLVGGGLCKDAVVEVKKYYFEAPV